MTAYYCPTCKTDRYSPVCPTCFYRDTDIEIESFVVYVSFIFAYPVGGELVNFEITPTSKDGLNIRTAETDTVRINRVAYRLASYVTRDDQGTLTLSDNDAYLSRGYPHYLINISKSAKEKGIALALEIAAVLFSGAYDDVLDAAEIIYKTRLYESAAIKYTEAKNAMLQCLADMNTHKSALLELGANLRTNKDN